MTYAIKQFNIPILYGISQKTMANHLELYAGYVKNANLILESREQPDPKEGTPEAIQHQEAYRRFAFEFDGMRNHELFFEQFEAGSEPLETPVTGIKAAFQQHIEIKLALEKQFGSTDDFIDEFKECAMTRGVGWAVLFYDKENDSLLLQWIDEQHNNVLTGLCPILLLDMWEHAYLMDYESSEKEKYVDAFFQNLNWSVIEKRYRDCILNEEYDKEI